MNTFAALKSSKNNMQKLLEQINKEGPSEKKTGDDRFWTPTIDKAGNGTAVIRFLPPSNGEDTPFVRLWDHGFQGPTGLWYIENSLTSLGKQDPVSEYNSQLWNSGIESNKDVVRKQKRRLYFVSNIYVVSDPGNPANEGKVFLYKYGKKIFDKLKDLMEPSFEDEDPVNPFDFWEGANFRMRIRNVEGYRNYDKSDFAKPAALLNDDEELENIWKKQYKLQEFLAPSNFKSYDELKKKLERVLGLDGTTKAPSKAELLDEQETPAPSFKSKEVAIATDDDDDGLEFFKNLVNK
jgi:hypothetical protein